MDFENCQPEESENDGAWRAISIAWVADETFAPQMVHRQVGVRLLLWDGVKAHWVNPILSGKESAASVSWTSSLTSTTD